MDDAELNTMSLLELQDLHARIHAAVRAKIRAQQQAMQNRNGQKSEPAETAPPLDLARERDAWLARKR